MAWTLNGATVTTSVSAFALAGATPRLAVGMASWSTSSGGTAAHASFLAFRCFPRRLAKAHPQSLGGTRWRRRPCWSPRVGRPPARSIRPVRTLIVHRLAAKLKRYGQRANSVRGASWISRRTIGMGNEPELHQVVFTRPGMGSSPARYRSSASCSRPIRRENTSGHGHNGSQNAPPSKIDGRHDPGPIAERRLVCQVIGGV